MSEPKYVSIPLTENNCYAAILNQSRMWDSLGINAVCCRFRNTDHLIWKIYDYTDEQLTFLILSDMKFIDPDRVLF